jgi:hypothetical protein
VAFELSLPSTHLCAFVFTACSAALHALYQLKLGFYASSIATLVLIDVRRKDFAATFIHHVATTLLIGMSLHLG